jgi:GTPase
LDHLWCRRREILGFDGEGHVVNHKSGFDIMTTEQICQKSSKIITFIDLAGHEKYIHTTVFGLTSRPPDFVAMVISATTGIVGTCAVCGVVMVFSII